MSAVYPPMSISKKILLVPTAVAQAIHIFFKPCHSKFMIFHAKICIWGKYLYVNHTLFILYLEKNHTLFGEKLYFIWKFSSGNTGVYKPLFRINDIYRYVVNIFKEDFSVFFLLISTFISAV